MWYLLFVAFVVVLCGAVWLRFLFNNDLVDMGHVGSIVFKCHRQSEFRKYSCMVLQSKKVQTFVQRFPLHRTAIDYVHVLDVKMFGKTTVGFVTCELIGIDSVCTRVVIRGDTTATVQRIMTPNYDVSLVVVNARPAFGGARPASFMVPLLRQLVVHRAATTDMHNAKNICERVRESGIVIEAIAGMMDECSTSSIDQAIQECREETGESICRVNLSNACPPFGTSQGLLDEQVTLWCGTNIMPNDDYVEQYIEDLQSVELTTHGNVSEGECTLRCLVPTDWLHLLGDCKLMAAQSYFMRCDLK